MSTYVGLTLKFDLTFQKSFYAISAIKLPLHALIMTELLTSCPVCGGSGFTNYLECTDYTVSKESFRLQACTSCGFVFTNPRPAAADIGVYYKSEDYISHTNSKKGLFNSVYQMARKNAIQTKLNLLDKYSPASKTLLDYGCGTGEFLNQAHLNGWNVKGIEPDPEARGMAISNYHLDVKDPSLLNTFKDGEFKAITLWHVLEHVHDLNETIVQFARILSNDGILVIAVPNHMSFDAKEYGEYWAGYDVPRHLYHFTKTSIEMLMKKHGLKVHEIKSLFFDPFYIALLSEKYKNGASNPLKAAWIGLQTTLKGRSDIEANSSLIYIIKKGN
jgi:2-polyprenyl-3-methyl-5-hydroxy-6-metoxy-1,4-benzoquinol methylase